MGALLPFALALPNIHPAPGYGHPAPAYGHPAPYHPAPAYGHPAPAYGHPAPHHGYGYEEPKQSCSVVDVTEIAEVCTPTIATPCEDIALPIKVIEDIPYTYTVTRTVCTESIEVVPQEVCTYFYEQESADTVAKTVEVTFKKVTDVQMVTVCAPGHQGYGHVDMVDTDTTTAKRLPKKPPTMSPLSPLLISPSPLPTPPPRRSVLTNPSPFPLLPALTSLRKRPSKFPPLSILRSLLPTARLKSVSLPAKRLSLPSPNKSVSN